MAYKFLITFSLFVMVMIFAVQNAAMVEIQLLSWEFAFPRSLLIFSMLLTGMTIGLLSRPAK